MADAQQPPVTKASPAPVRSGAPRWLVALLSVFVAVVLLVFAGLWYISTPQFAEKVRVKLVDVLASATGGRVELRAFHWDIWHLAFEADDLTIHGLEGPGEVPYAHVDMLRIRLKILSLIHPQAGVRLLEVAHPVFHLIVYPNGTTNQPVPKTSSSNSNGTLNTVFDLKANRVNVWDGWVILNQRKTPFAISANDLKTLIQYRPSDDKYVAALDVNDLSVQLAKKPEVHSHLTVDAVLGRDMLQLGKLDFSTGRSRLLMDGQMLGFADPKITGDLHGHISARDVAFLTGFNEVNQGSVQIDLAARLHGQEYAADGSIRGTGLAYNAGYLRLADVRIFTDLHVDSKVAKLSKLDIGVLGASIRGEAKYTNWQSPISEKSPALKPRAEFATVATGMDVREILRAVLKPRFSDIGFNTRATGKAFGGWTGSPANIEATAQVHLDPIVRPTGLPMQGDVDATYSGVTNTVVVRTLEVHTPASNISAHGSLDVAIPNSNTALQADVSSTNLGEFDNVLLMAGVGTAQKGQSPSSTLPIRLHGEAHYAGRVYGPLDLLRVTGHLDVTHFDTIVAAARPQAKVVAKQVSNARGGNAVPVPGPAASVNEIAWDALHTDVDVASDHASVSNLTLTRRNTTIKASASIAVRPGDRVAYDFDKHSTVKANLAVDNAGIPDLLTIAGQSSVPVTGTLSLHVQAQGKVEDIQAQGHLTVTGGEAYGQPYKSLNADITGNHSDVGVTNLVFLLDGGRMTGSAGYDVAAVTFHGDVTGSGFKLDHLQALASQKQPIGGNLQFHFTGNGPVKAPVVNGSLQVQRISLSGQQLGDVGVNLHTAINATQNTLFVDANSTLLNSHLALNGQVGLAGDYPAQAKLTIAGTDVAPLLAIFAPKAAGYHSEVEGQATLQGPLKTPKLLNVDATIGTLALNLPQFALKNDGPLRFSLANGRLRIDQFKITGPDSVLTAHGTAGVFGARDLGMQVDGSVNLAVAQKFSNEIVSNGRVTLNMAANGTMDRPDLTGSVKFLDANVAYLDFPNGLSHLNGSLDFNQDRLEVNKLTAQTGGGTISFGGFLTYQNGAYANLTVAARNVRVRYPQGISSTADADIRLQGTQDSATVGGNVQVTRFALGGSLSASSNGATISEPPDPNALSSHILLDVHISSSPQLNFENSYATLAGSVDLRVRGSVAAPSVLGRVNITQGSANFAGTDYQLTRGDIFFSNPVRIDPVIDLDATAQVRDYDISLGVHGTLEKLNTTYRSEPPLPQSDIIALLALGRTQEQAQIYQQQQAEAGVDSTTNSLLGGALNATVSNRVQKLFGVGQVKIDPNFVGSLGNSTARVTVQQQLSKQVTVTYATNVNETTQQLIQVQIAVNREVSLQLNRDEAGVFNALIHVRQRKK